MSDQVPLCPECGSEHAYPLGALLVCPMCAHEWAPDDPAGDSDGGTDGDGPRVITDAVGNVLADGDTVTIIKDLKVKGSSQSVKVGTKVRGIRLVDGVGDHDIDCRIDGFGPMQLKSSGVKKA